MNQYDAKFERESKSNPRDWIIIPAGGLWVSLVYIGGRKV